MISNRSLRFVEAQTPPFRAVAIVKADLNDQIWAQAKAESMLLQQIGAQVGGHINSLPLLRKLGVYTVRYESETGHYIHEVEAPDGITFQTVEEVPRWWEAEDNLPMDRVPNGNALTIALLPTITMEEWRNSTWRDRPHP